MENDKVVADKDQYSMTLSHDKTTLVFSWKHVAGLSIPDLRAGVAQFAGQCRTHRPTRAVIDARQLDPNSEALAWVTSRKKFTDQEDYNPWWIREIVPVYHTAGIVSLSVATGDPNAPGEITAPPGVEFKMGYFTDLRSAMQWNG